MAKQTVVGQKRWVQGNLIVLKLVAYRNLVIRDMTDC
jgi:hypothetical protein